MITAGCDLGSMTAKAVILIDGKIAASRVIKGYSSPEKSAAEVIKAAVEEAGIKPEDIEYAVGTGYGRKNINFINSVESEIACHAKGAVRQVPDAGTVVDIGGQDAKAIRLDEKGNVLRYVYNDKCASGTGRFLELIAEALDIPLEKLGDISLESSEHLTLSNQCVVFAETEIISLVSEGKEIADIINALHNAVASRAASLAKSITVENAVVMTGGVAKNPGMFRALEKALGVELKSVQDPQIAGALGAAIIAEEALKGKR